MFGTIRKHQGWLWGLIIAAMIIGLISWQSQLGKSGSDQRGPGNFGVVDNRPVTETEYRNAQNEASLLYFIRYGEWPEGNNRSGFDLDRETYFRLFLTRKLEQYNIHVDSDSVARAADYTLSHAGNSGPVPLEAFVDQLLKPHGMGADDFERYIEHNLAIQQLASVVGLGGQLVTPGEIQSLYIQQNQQLAVDAVFFSASNFVAKVPQPTPEALAQFYTNEQAAYREPDQMQLSYVYFNVTNFMPEAEKALGTTNLSRMADEALTRLGTNGLRYGKTAEEAKARIRDILIEDTALSNAYVKALSFQTDVQSGATNAAAVTKDLAAAAKAKGLEAKVTAPFDKEYGPMEIHLGSYPVAALFNLTASDPFPDQPVRGQDGVYVIAYNNLIPSRIPSLTEIHDRVLSDYKRLQAVRLAQITGQIFEKTVTNDLAHAKTFAAACEAAKVSPVTIPPFSLSTESVPEVEDHAELNTFKEIAFMTASGKVSNFTPGSDGGFVVYVRERLPIDQVKMKADLPEFGTAVRQRREGEAFESWFNREASIALSKIPELQQQQRK